MRLTVKLLGAHWRRHWFRTLLAFGAMITSVAMVVVVVGGQDVTISQAGLASQKASGALGRFDLIVVAGTPSAVEASRRQFGARPPLPGMNKKMLSWLQSRPEVQGLLECSEMSIEACPSGQVFRLAAYSPGQLLSSPLMATDCSDPPYTMLLGNWVTGACDDEVVIDARQVRRLVPSDGSRAGLGGPGGPGGPRGSGFGGPGMEEPPPPPASTIGTTFQLITQTGRHEVRIRGVIKAPYAGRSLAGMYVSPTAYEKLTGNKPEVNRVVVDLKDGLSVEDFADTLQKGSAQTGQPIHVETIEDIREAAGRLGMMGPSGGGGGFFPLLRNASMNMAILAAIFVVFSTLNMGLAERTRQLAMLRAIGMTRRQLVGLIVAEAFVLALVGWLAGVAVGWGLMRNTIAGMPALAGQDVPLHIGLWLGLGALTAFGATFAAAVLPAFLAARRRPLEGMEGAPLLRSAGPPLWMIPIGLVLIAANPVLSMAPLVPEPARTIIVLPLTCLAAIIGFALVMPILVVICERLFGRLTASLFGLNYRLLSKQLSSGLWRTVGCATALMVGLGLYVTVQVWGQSMLRPFLVTERSPDAIVTIKPEGVPLDRLDDVRKLDGVRNVVPMILQYPDVTNLPDTVQVGGIFSREVIYVGCDVQAMLDEKTGIMEASFVRGSAKDAFAQLADGNSCIITDGLYLRAPDQYDVGRRITLDTSDGGVRKSVEHVIAGVVEMPGWQLLTKSSQMRRGMERVGALVIVPEATAVSIYPDAKYKTFWFQLAGGKNAASLELPMIRIVDPSAKLTGPTSRPVSRPSGLGRAPDMAGAGGPDGIGPVGGAVGSSDSGPIGGRRGGRGGMVGRGMTVGGAASMIDSRYYARVTDTRAMTEAIRGRAEGIIESMTIYPLMALGLSALAVIGTVISSVRVRTWEMGVLRSIGLTRGQVLRQVLAEGMLIGLLACVVSLMFGLLVSWTGIYSSTRFWGVSAPFVIPWANVLLGIGVTVALCIAASTWPALTAAFRQPLRLLQEGRTVE